MPLTRPLVRTLGTSLKNAVVPDDAPILPFQAYVDYVEIIIGSFTLSTNISVNGLSYLDPFTLIDNATDGNAVAFWGGSTTTRDFSLGTMQTAAIDLVLASASGADGSSGMTGGSLDLSGADMGVPTPAQPRIPGTALFQCASYPNDGDTLDIDGTITADLYKVTFDASVDFADSGTVGFENVVGIQDTPTIGQINTYLDTYGGLTDGEILVTNDSELPLSDNSTPGLLAAFTAGQFFSLNADLETAVNNGATITVMEYVNRADDTEGKESVTYTP